MIRYLAITLRGHLRQSPVLYALTVFGVALGVGSVLSIQVINHNALAAFSGSIRAVSHDADLSILGRAGSVDERLLPRVLAQPEVQAAWPLVRADAVVESHPDVRLEIHGFDVFAPLRLPLQQMDAEGELRDADVEPGDPLRVPGWVALSPELARDLGVRTGDALPVSVGSRRAVLRVGALVDFRRYTALASRRLAVMDIAQVQARFGEPGRVQQIDVRLADGVDRDTAQRALAARLGPAVRVAGVEDREDDARGLLRAFRLNLTALSLVSLFVGVFLIFSSTQAALVRRRFELGLLRTLGASRRQVLALTLAEVLLLATAGTLAGMPLGVWVARANVDVVSGTLTNIYLLEAIEHVQVPGRLVALAVAVGLGGALAGALLPALDVSRRDTRALLVPFTLHARASRLAAPLAWAGVVVATGFAAWWLAAGRDARAGGFVLGFGMLVTLPLWTPLLLKTVCARVPVRRLGPWYSLRNLSLRLQTSAFAVAALGAAVSMLVGITLLIGSFRHTLDTWVDRTVRADVFVTTPSWRRAVAEARLEPALVESLAAQPGVRGIETLRQRHVEANGRRVVLSGLGSRQADLERRIPLRHGDPARAWQALRRGDGVLVSEPLARKARLDVGDTLRVATPAGPRPFVIAGVSYDYSSEEGAVLMDLGVFERWFGKAPVNNVALYLEPGLDAERFVDRLRARFAAEPLLIRSNRELREEIFRIFDQTFAITRILQVLALLIAASGIASTLLVLARERTGELALYRALGATRRQLFGVFLGEGLGLGVFGLVLGTIGGIGLAAVLVFLINPAYFGWTIRPSWPWAAVLRESLWILGTAALASLYPALRASRTPGTQLARDDL